MTTTREYHIHEAIGHGAFGTVYRAQLVGQGGFNKTVAIKVLKQAPGMEDIAARLRDEARLLGLVRHKALLQVDGLVMLEGRWSVVTEYLDGCSLGEAMGRTDVPVGVMLEICAEVAGGLHAAYTSTNADGESIELIHRDIKPANVHITRAGEVKLLDFGVARGKLSTREANSMIGYIGTPAYMAPERLDGVHGPAGDIYALGLVLAEGMLGDQLGKTSSDFDEHEQFLFGVLKRLEDKLGDAFTPIKPLLMVMLAYDAEDRPSARDVERSCRDLYKQTQDLHLVEWAAKNIHRGKTRRNAEDNDEPDLSGRRMIAGRLSIHPTSSSTLTGHVIAESPAQGTTSPIQPVPQTGSNAPRVVGMVSLLLLVAAASFFAGRMQRQAEVSAITPIDDLTPAAPEG